MENNKRRLIPWRRRPRLGEAVALRLLEVPHAHARAGRREARPCLAAGHGVIQRPPPSARNQQHARPLLWLTGGHGYSEWR
jgi:hypothetical protein